MIPQTCTNKELQEFLNMPERTFKRYKRAGIFGTIERGQYDLKQNIQNYIQCIKKGGSEEKELDYNKEKALLTRVQRELAELELAKEQEKLVYSTDVYDHCLQVANVIKTKLLGVPSRIAPQLLAQDNIAKINEVIYNAIWEALNDIGKLSPTTAESFEDENTT